MRNEGMRRLNRLKRHADDKRRWAPGVAVRQINPSSFSCIFFIILHWALLILSARTATDTCFCAQRQQRKDKSCFAALVFTGTNPQKNSFAPKLDFSAIERRYLELNWDFSENQFNTNDLNVNQSFCSSNNLPTHLHPISRLCEGMFVSDFASPVSNSLLINHKPSYANQQNHQLFAGDQSAASTADQKLIISTESNSSLRNWKRVLFNDEWEINNVARLFPRASYDKNPSHCNICIKMYLYRREFIQFSNFKYNWTGTKFTTKKFGNHFLQLTIGAGDYL